MMDYQSKYEQWCTDPIFDKETKAELQALPEMRKRLRIVFIRIFLSEPVDFEV